MRCFLRILVAQMLMAGSSSTPFSNLFVDHAGKPMVKALEATNDESGISQRSVSSIFTVRSQFQKRGAKKQAAHTKDCQGNLQKRGQCLSSPPDRNIQRQNEAERSSEATRDRTRSNPSSSAHIHEHSSPSQSPTSETVSQPPSVATVPVSKWPPLQRTQSFGSLTKLKDAPRPTLRRVKSIALMVDTPSIKAEAAGKTADAAEAKARLIRDATSVPGIKAHQSLIAIRGPYRSGLQSHRLTLEKIRRHDKANTDAHAYIRHLTKLSRAFSEAADASQDANRATRAYRNKKKQGSAILEGEVWKSSAKWNSYNAQYHRVQLRVQRKGGLINHDATSTRDLVLLGGRIEEAKQLARYDNLQLQRHVEDGGYDSDIGRRPAAMESVPPLTLGNRLVRPPTPSPSGSYGKPENDEKLQPMSSNNSMSE